MALLYRRKDVPQQTNYRKYKPYLREDFGYACVYCQIHENESGGPRDFHVEHFRPKIKYPDLILVYDNLLYACPVCNSYKGDDWPSDDPLKDGRGYIDPCEHDYEAHFVPKDNFELKALSTVANYMLEKLHLNRNQLIKVRRNRHKDEEQYQQFMELCQDKLNQINEQLQELNLINGNKLLLLEEQIHYQNLLTKRQEAWKNRWYPKIELEDYS